MDAGWFNLDRFSSPKRRLLLFVACPGAAVSAGRGLAFPPHRVKVRNASEVMFMPHLPSNNGAAVEGTI